MVYILTSMSDSHIVEKLAHALGDFVDYIYVGSADEPFIFRTMTKLDELPELENKCLCGHAIKKQCWIQNIHTREIKTVGSTCMKRFMPEEMQGMKCRSCPKNRTTNSFHCNACIKNEYDRICKHCGEYRYKCDKQNCSVCDGLFHTTTLVDGKCPHCSETKIRCKKCGIEGYEERMRYHKCRESPKPKSESQSQIANCDVDEDVVFDVIPSKKDLMRSYLEHYSYLYPWVSQIFVLDKIIRGKTTVELMEGVSYFEYVRRNGLNLDKWGSGYKRGKINFDRLQEIVLDFCITSAPIDTLLEKGYITQSEANVLLTKHETEKAKWGVRSS